MASKDYHQRRSAKTDSVPNLAPGRECGACVVCCESLKIDWPDLKKEADVLCRHNTGRGCNIYDTRPDGCKTWFCLWRRIGALPDAMRPDRCGLLISIDRTVPPSNPFEQVSIVIRAIGDPAALDGSLAKAAIDMFAGEGSLPVHVSDGQQKKLVYPPPEMVEAIQQPILSPCTPLAREARSWRERLGLPEM
jgi:hypothetical protein